MLQADQTEDGLCVCDWSGVFDSAFFRFHVWGFGFGLERICADRSSTPSPDRSQLAKRRLQPAKTKLGWEPNTNCQELAEIMVDHDLEIALNNEVNKSSLAEQ